MAPRGRYPQIHVYKQKYNNKKQSTLISTEKMIAQVEWTQRSISQKLRKPQSQGEQLQTNNTI